MAVPRALPTNLQNSRLVMATTVRRTPTSITVSDHYSAYKRREKGAPWWLPSQLT